MNTIVKSLIDGVVITELRQICDERGAVLHMLRCDAPEFTNFGECYFSEVIPGCIKAWKRHSLQTQNLTVPVGRIKMVIFDDRHDSNTKGRVQEIEIGRPDNYIRLQIPTGLWYGFACVSTTPALLVNCADIPHDPNEGEVCEKDNPLIPYKW